MSAISSDGERTVNEASQRVVPRRYSLIFWALLAMCFVAGSYLLTLALAVGCIALFFRALSTLSAGVNVQLLALGACGLVIGLTILWSLVPRRDKFHAPGALLQRSCYPRFFAELDHIASSLDEVLPNEVYLVPDLNAWVAERGGVMGFGGRRVMGVGLPLLSVLSVSQFRAVLAHEFGHYYGGDTSLGPWVYKTRDGMVRMLRSLSDPSEILQLVTRFAIAGALHQLVVAMLVGYWNLFLRAIQMISRRQEYRADELACRLVSSQALIQGLRTIHGAGMVVRSYWDSEVAPLLGSGYRPPIAEGFRRFVSSPLISKAIGEQLDKQLREAQTQPYDSHPLLRDRIAAADRWSTSSQIQEDAQASTLIDDIGAAELELLQMLDPQLKQSTLRLVSWDNFTAEFLIPMWKENVVQFTSLLQPITSESLPDTVKNLWEIGSHIPDPKGMLLTPEQRTGRVLELLGTALGLVLIDHGWNVFAQPGQFYLRRDTEKLNPMAMVADIASGKITREDWIEHCRNLEILGCPLAKSGSAAARQ